MGRKKTAKKLKDSVLLALYMATEGTFGPKGKKVPIEAVTSRFRTHLRGSVKDALHMLEREGLVISYPKGRKRVWQLTKSGKMRVNRFY